MKIRCAVIGIGSMGKKYALMIDGGKINSLELVAVCCRSDDNVNWAKNNLNSSIKIYRNEDEMYNDLSSFDAVLIVTPHKLHPAMTIRALKANKHVMCDKPAGITFSDAEKINAVANNTDKVFAMMCHQRTYEYYKKIKELLNKNEIGEITRVSMENSNYFRTEYYHHSANWRSSWNGEGGGALINQGYHLLDMWQYLFGLPQEIYANIPFGKYNNFDVDDEATIIMNYPNKMTGSFILSTGEASLIERLEIVGTKGRISLNEKTLTITYFSDDIKNYSKEAKVTSRQELNMAFKQYKYDDPEKPYEIMLNNFADAILKGDKLIAPGIDSSNTLTLVNASYLSAWQGKKVSLPLDSNEYLKYLHEKEKQEISKGE